MPEDIRVAIRSNLDIVTARHEGRGLSIRIGFSATDATLIATAISELARNIVSYAREGEILLRVLNPGDLRGIMIVSRDSGPGIASIDDAMRDGFSTSGGLGLGLPGVRRLMDEFLIKSEPGEGTTVCVTKWLR
ncbi:MAG TPA: anti-sigma regulatory factor [Steroidobacteraceae bacterium]|nr:anti-sigma regulatory factor [Steroidobacteraceae bacterium]